MMMLPESTDSPPNFLTPSRLECESRPLRVLPPAFLCAMDYVSSKPLSDDLRDLDVGVELAMRARTLVVLAAAEFDDHHLIALTVALDGPDDLRAADERRADLDVGARANEKDFIEFDARTLR